MNEISVLLVKDMDAEVTARQMGELEPEWKIDFISRFGEVLNRLRAEKRDVLIMDILGPDVISGQGVCPDITAQESYGGLVTGAVLALRLKDAYPDLSIIVAATKYLLNDHPDMVRVCRLKGVLLVDVASGIENTIVAIKKLMSRKAK